MKTLTAEEMYHYEEKIMNDKGVPSNVLMECAARAIAAQMKQTITKKDQIVIVAGGGNNGGDGIAVGRILHNEGFQVEILVVGNPDHYSEQNRLQQKIAKGYGASIKTDLDGIDFTKATVIVDALFGIGLNRPVEGKPLKAIEKMNAAKQARVYAIDAPSGISSVEGKALGTCIIADETITFGFYKHGMEKDELQDYFGHITVDDIGFFYEE
ncbi:NAD(P)H-hydrate epimerase [Tetragenococcus koreensis]|uniref:NAD(P)H-hydrate epimerase n=1 Tax=Tetragenococcus koreensis TaxID=290335 RepID=UPI001F27F1B1|nr:NAD(P)H-hydrate epimerase [Tetragenococcus koreensis]MCF1632386.1 NAD(P)H-hydrate epimerase [Tetragenococcus koreensis]